MKLWKLFSFIVLLSIVLLGTSTTSFAMSVTDSGFTYQFINDDDGNEVAQILQYNGTAETLIIPSEIEGKPVCQVCLSDPNYWGYDFNTTVKKVVLPDTVRHIGAEAFREYSALEEIEGLEHVEHVGQQAFEGTKVKRLIFSENLKSVDISAFQCETLQILRIPDDLGLGLWKNFAQFNAFRYNFALESIELIKTGNTPNLIKDGPALYTKDMKTLIVYPCAYDGQYTYHIPDGVEEIAIYAFQINDNFRSEGVMDIVVPSSVTKIYQDSLYTDLYFLHPEVPREHFFMPHMHVEAGSTMEGYCKSQNYTYYINGEGNVTVDERVAEILASVIQPAMTDYEKAYALYDWMTHNVTYDHAIQKFTPDMALLLGTGVCQSYMLSYEMLLKQVGIPCRQYFVGYGIVNLNDRHGLNAMYLDGEWSYADATWGASSREDASWGGIPQPDAYFGMNEDMTYIRYAGEIGCDPDERGKNGGYQHFALYRSGKCDAYLRAATEQLTEIMKETPASIYFSSEILKQLYEECGAYDARGYLISAALLAAYWRDYDWGENIHLLAQYDRGGQGISVIISYADVLPENYTFSAYNGGMRIDSYLGNEEQVVIPAWIGGLPVVAIGEFAFENNRSIVTVTMPDSITEIGNFAFYNCENLVSIDLSPNIVSMGDRALGHCKKLESIELPSVLTNVGSDLLYYSNIKHVTIPDSMTAIPESMFSWCQALESVELPATIRKIESFAFWQCESLKKVTIPASVKEIGYHAFYGAPLQEIVLPESVENIGAYAFCGTAASEVTIPASVKNIGDYAFLSSPLKSVTLNEGLKVLGEGAFWNTQIESIVIPSSVTEIGDSCFSMCSNLKEVKVAQDNQHYTSVRNLLYTKDLSKILFCPPGVTGRVILPPEVRSVGAKAFLDCTKITTIIFQGRLNELGRGAFENCSSMTKITIPEGVQVLPVECFFNCRSLKDVKLPESLRKIETFAFQNCDALADVVIPDGVTEIEELTFHIWLEVFRIPAGITLLADNFLNMTHVGELYVHKDVTYIGLNNMISEPYTVYGEPGTYAETYARNNGYTFVPFSTVEVPEVPGDAGGDGAVDVLDALLVLQYAVGWDVSVIDDNADVNGDGLVNILDALRIIQLCLGGDSASVRDTLKALAKSLSINLLEITGQPADQYVAPGVHAQFTVTAVGDGLTYQWYIDRNDGKGWCKLNGAVGKTYVTSATELGNDGFRYRCVIADAYGDQLTSDTGVLHVVLELPGTGDAAAPMLWIAACGLSMMGMVLLLKHSRRMRQTH